MRMLPRARGTAHGKWGGERIRDGGWAWRNLFQGLACVNLGEAINPVRRR